MRKSAIIQQPFGLGDCIFAQGIAHMFLNYGYKVYWPVLEKYVAGLRCAYPKIEWVTDNLKNLSPIQKDEILSAKIVPIRWSDTFTGQPYEFVMKAKYDMYGLDWRSWKDFAKYNRLIGKEKVLEDLYAIKPGDRYALISKNYTSEFKLSMQTIVPDNPDLKIIEIKEIGLFSLFDWSSIIENAEEIHFVSSSNIYMLELLDLKAKSINLYKRLPDQPSHRYYHYILNSHKYNFK